MKDRDKILFHGSYLEIREPEDNKTETASTDFGEGFYLTELQSQAEKWARRKFNQRKRFDKTAHSVVNVYSLQYDKTINRFQEKYKFFSKTSDEWLDFIVECRSKGQDRYDFVEGPMSDDKLYNFVQNYIDGTISRNEFWELARYKYPTHQIMMRKDALKCLKFIEAYEVEIEE